MPARTPRQKEVRRHLIIYGALTPYIVIAIFPIYWMAITALKQDPDLYRMDQFPLWFHLSPTWKNFSYLFYNTNYGAWLVNTMVIAVWVAITNPIPQIGGFLVAQQFRFVPGQQRIQPAAPRLFGGWRNCRHSCDFGQCRSARPQLSPTYFHKSWLSPRKADHHGVFASNSARSVGDGPVSHHAANPLNGRYIEPRSHDSRRGKRGFGRRPSGRRWRQPR